MSTDQDNSFGTFLKDRRARLDPTALGLSSTRRRTPGLRREEVAQRAYISVSWYTWLEQGRGGDPSAAVLERIATALMLSDAEREHLFLLGLGRPPKAYYHSVEGISSRLQLVLDGLVYSPAFIKTLTWDVVAWNRAAAVVLTDYAALPPEERNILRLMFLDPRIRAAQSDWEGIAQYVVAAFRADVARVGSTPKIEALVDELCRRSPEFEAMWRDNEVRNFSEGAKRLQHPVAGSLALEHSGFIVDGRPDLGMVIYSPATVEDADRIRLLMTDQVEA